MEQVLECSGKKLLVFCPMTIDQFIAFTHDFWIYFSAYSLSTAFVVVGHSLVSEYLLVGLLVYTLFQYDFQ